MKRLYEPLPMIMNGRYAVLYGKLSAFSLGPKRQRLLHRRASHRPAVGKSRLPGYPHEKRNRVPR